MSPYPSTPNSVSITPKSCDNPSDHILSSSILSSSNLCDWTLLIFQNYFNKALDTFSTNVVNPIYYVFFTTATIVASAILFQGFNTTDATNTLSLICGFLIIFMGVYLLNISRQPEAPHHNTSLESGLMSESSRLICAEFASPLFLFRVYPQPPTTHHLPLMITILGIYLPNLFTRSPIKIRKTEEKIEISHQSGSGPE